ncbi:MAG: EAL domain-containing protein [Actinobacteria bacterium]|nr:EAL domain-containing protein [Actinomycetota bacterium]
MSGSVLRVSPDPRSPSAPSAVALRLAVVLLGFAVIVWQIMVATGTVTRLVFTALDVPSLILISVVFAASVLVALAAPPDTRRAWMILAVVTLSGVVGDVVHSMLCALGSDPVVSVADIVYLAGYPFLLFALWWVARCRGGRAGVQAMFDGLLLAAGLSMLVWELLRSTLEPTTSALTWDTGVLLAYPLLDLALLGAAVGVVLSSRHLSAVVVWISCYLLATIVGDVIFLREALLNVDGAPWSSLVYTVAFICLGMAATSRSAMTLAEPSADPSEIGRVRFILLGASLAAPAITAAIILWVGNAVAVPVLLISTAAIAFLVSWRVADAVRSERATRRTIERAHHALWEQSRQDALTGLGNRSALLGDVEGYDASVGVLFVDLDRFKQVNDTSGHAAGDDVLCEVTRRMRNTTHSNESVYRLSGDEFVVIHRFPLAGIDLGSNVRGEPTVGAAPIVDHAQTILKRAAHFVEVLSRPYFPKGMEWHLTASIGCAVSKCNGSVPESPDDLLQRADIAMYHAKRDRPGAIRVFDDAMQRDLDDEHDMEISLRRAVDESAYAPAVQPIVNLHDGSIVGFEALARWRRPSGEVVPASAFIDTAERAGLLPQIQAQVMDKALEFLRDWQHSNPDRRVAYLTLNASATEIVETNFIERLLERLSRVGVRPDSIVVELTEGALVAAPDVVSDRLNHLRRLGFRVALDDFGTGYSSLSHLLDFSVDVVKIDRTFVAELNPALGSTSVVSATYQLAETLGLEVIAEGVETAEQIELLVEIGVMRAQGFGLTRPLLVADAMELPIRLDLPRRVQAPSP